MKASVGFIFFMLFLAGIALVNLRGMKNRSDATIMAAPELANSAWRATHIGEMRLPDDTTVSIHFKDESALAGHAGCNRYFGNYDLQDGIFNISSVGTTRMACPEPAASFELAFLAAIQNARSLARTDSRMAMRDESGVVVLRLIADERAVSEP